MQFTTEQNKRVVIRFNKEFIEQGNMESFKELVAPDVINHSAPAGSSAGPDGMIHFLQHILKTAFPDVKVEILDQLAEGDLVATRKTLHATHTGILMGIPPSGRKVAINVMDIIRLKNGQYAEHWGMSNLSDIVSQISSSV
jgi:steroid delta-isomerase-like uncharacterized protein